MLRSLYRFLTNLTTKYYQKHLLYMFSENIKKKKNVYE